jgi:hypothetical protein
LPWHADCFRYSGFHELFETRLAAMRVGFLRIFMTSSCISKDFFSAGDLRSVLEGRNAMSRAVNRILYPAAGRPQSPAAAEAESGLNISVIFTAVESTLAALKHAGSLASNLGARISLVVPQVVPYPLPLNSPQVSRDFTGGHFSVIVGQSRVETNVAVYLCRDRLETLRAVLKPRSLVVIGGRKSWWPTSEQRLAAHLRRAGHEVVFSEME